MRSRVRVRGRVKVRVGRKSIRRQAFFPTNPERLCGGWVSGEDGVG